MDSNHWQNCFSYRISLQDRFLIDFGESKTSPRLLQGGARRLKTPPKRRQDASKTAQDASGRFQDDPETLPILHLTLNRLEFTKRVSVPTPKDSSSKVMAQTTVNPPCNRNVSAQTCQFRTFFSSGLCNRKFNYNIGKGPFHVPPKARLVFVHNASFILLVPKTIHNIQACMGRRNARSDWIKTKELQSFTQRD